MPAAEGNGLMVQIGKSVGQAFDELGSMLEPGTLGLWLNLGPAELTGDRLIEDLAVALARSGVDPDALTVEVTESGVFRDEERAIAAMANLRDLGVHLSIDEFGTGYSSLSRLAEFPIESVKIRLAFVSRLTGDARRRPWSMIRLADWLGLATVAEGIEHPAAVRRLRRRGCSLGQGYLFSKPLPAAELLPLLENPKQLRSVVPSSRLSIAARADATTGRGLDSAHGASVEGAGMQFQVKGRNFEVSDSIRSYAEEKLSKLERQLTDPRVELELMLEKNPSIAENQVAEATIWTSGPVLRAREASSDMRASIDQLVEKLERQVTRYRTRGRDRRRRAARANAAAEAASASADELELEIVKTKQFALDAMTPEEAVLQLELVGHDFFVFRSGDSEAVNIVYRRRDGGYGLIEPQ